MSEEKDSNIIQTEEGLFEKSTGRKIKSPLDLKIRACGITRQAR